MADDKQNYTKTGIDQSHDIVTRMRTGRPSAVYDIAQQAADEIERLRAVLDAERALADQLAVALLGTASGRIIPTDDEWAGVVKMRSAALDAWEARRG